MDPLTQQLLQRKLGPPSMVPPSGGPQPWAGIDPTMAKPTPVPGSMNTPPPGIPGSMSGPPPPGIPPPPGPINTMMTPNPTTKVPPQARRFGNSQRIQSAYANGWNPNPVLLRAQLGNK